MGGSSNSKPSPLPGENAKNDAEIEEIAESGEMQGFWKERPILAAVRGYDNNRGYGMFERDLLKLETSRYVSPEECGWERVDQKADLNNPQRIKKDEFIQKFSSFDYKWNNLTEEQKKQASFDMFKNSKKFQVSLFFLSITKGLGVYDTSDELLEKIKPDPVIFRPLLTSVMGTWFVCWYPFIYRKNIPIRLTRGGPLSVLLSIPVWTTLTIEHLAFVLRNDPARSQNSTSESSQSPNLATTRPTLTNDRHSLLLQPTISTSFDFSRPEHRILFNRTILRDLLLGGDESSDRYRYEIAKEGKDEVSELWKRVIEADTLLGYGPENGPISVERHDELLRMGEEIEGGWVPRQYEERVKKGEGRQMMRVKRLKIREREDIEGEKKVEKVEKDGKDEKSGGVQMIEEVQKVEEVQKIEERVDGRIQRREVEGGVGTNEATGNKQ